MTNNPKGTFTLKVEPRHFEGATRLTPNNCGVAKALKEVGINLPIDPFHAGEKQIGPLRKYFGELGNFLRIADYSEDAAKAVFSWDDGGPVPPPFTLELPISLFEEAQLETVNADT